MKKILLALFMAGLLAFGSPAFAGDKTLTFQWEYADPAGQGVTLFRIYASTVAGNYSPNDLLAEMPFTGESAVYETDAVLTSPDGVATMWFFIARAVDGQGNESANSNEVNQLIDFEAPGAVFNFSVSIKVTP